MSNLYGRRAIGVLGTPEDQRSVRDQQLQHDFSGCRKLEKYSPGGVGITQTPNEYGERRSPRDQQMLKTYNPCGSKEGYDGGCGYASIAKISDTPYNALAMASPRISVANMK
jgi:hypothetical protein